MAKLIIEFTPKFKKQYRKLPLDIQKKFTKQLKLLEDNFRHPSLKTKKMEGINKFEGRIDLHYRFTYKPSEDSLTFFTIGQHDKGLGKN